MKPVSPRAFRYACLFLSLCATAWPEPAKGPLRVLPSNPRYFTDGSGKAVYLTGSHTWANQQDHGITGPPPVFDFNAYLDFLQAHNHNFIRLRRKELTRYSFKGFFENHLIFVAGPQPWARTGPGLALDGQPKFNLDQFDESYFQRLRDRVIAARGRGIYVSVMLFDGHGIADALQPWCWDAHPFNAANNINGIDGDPNRTGRGTAINTLDIPAVKALQEAYIRKTVDAVNDLDNVLYEISNESENFPGAVEWQYHVIRFIKTYEGTKPKQHPVGMTFILGSTDDTLFDSPADWISPGPSKHKNDPPAADGRKVVISDTDHLWGEGGTFSWVWKSFTRGINTLYMDRVVALDKGDPMADIPGAEDARKNMGYTLAYAKRMNLASTAPHPELSSTTYCLAQPGKEYLIYQPASAEFTVQLPAGAYKLEWFNPLTGKVAAKVYGRRHG